MRNYIPRKAGRHSTVCKDVRKHKTKQPTCLTNNIYIKLPTEYADALYEMYPDMTLTKALRKHVLMTVKPKNENSD